MKNIYFEISLKIARAYGEKIKELRQLRTENAELKQEIERLKQAEGFDTARSNNRKEGDI